VPRSRREYPSAARIEDTIAMQIRDSLRETIRHSPLYPWVQRSLEWVRAERDLRLWVRRGASGSPPHVVKQGVVREHARRYGLRTLIETGTYFGNMVDVMRREMDRVVSIEVDTNLAALARHRFEGDRKVTIIQGDSAKVMADLVPTLDAPALFWLDGHYSGGETSFGESHCPIMQELPPILTDARFAHVILIDDARTFGADPAYPSVEEVRALVARHRPDLEFSLANDILRFAPAR
jgi:hypothetical protein